MQLRLTLGLVLSVMFSASALASDKPLKLLESGLQVRGWEGVGRLDLGQRGFCTGALISERHVLTAAHCLFDKKTGERFEDGEITFRAGLRNGRAAAEGRVLRSVVHPLYAPLSGAEMDNVAHDLALLELTFPIRNLGVVPFAVYSEPRGGDQVGVVSYGRNRAEAPSLQESCRVIERDRNGVLVMSCSVDFGSSGAPVFGMSQGRAHIVSVVSATGQAAVEGAFSQVSLGASLGPRLDELHRALAAQDQRFIRASDTRPTGQTQRQMSAGGGARFMRP